MSGSLPPTVREVQRRARIVLACGSGPDGEPYFRSSHQCRLCGHWSEGDWNGAPREPEGDAVREKAQREMDRGCCDGCWAALRQ